jgi:hypothetical protein
MGDMGWIVLAAVVFGGWGILTALAGERERRVREITAKAAEAAVQQESR